MSQLNTIFSLDKVLNTNSDLNIEEKGTLNIKYSGTVSSKESDAIMTGLVTRDGDYVSIELMVKFQINSECSRCLKISKQEKEAYIDEKLYIKKDNDFDINFKDENIDLQPIISEKIIDKVEYEDKEPC